MSSTQLNELFAAPPTRVLGEDVLAELQSIMRIHSLSEQELFFKWEAYSIKMGLDGLSLDYKTVRDFKKDVQDALERESRGKTHVQSASKKSHTSTPRTNGSSDVYGVLNGLVGGTPSGPKSVIKRKSTFDTPPTKVAKTPGRKSPTSEQKTPSLRQATPFYSRPNPGQLVESLNGQIHSSPDQTDRREALAQHTGDPRVKLKANTELAKFNYRPMAMKLTEASEILDDRLDEFALLVQEHHDLSPGAFGNPAAQGTAEIVAVGRIASDVDGKLTNSSLVLETSRRVGAGMRIPLRMADSLAYDFFPGKIVALRGTNPAGEYFSVSEILSIPLLHLPASTFEEIEAQNAKLQISGQQHSGTQPLNIILGSGPYTTDADLSFDAFNVLLDRAAETSADVLILNGPFLDIQHPLVSTGEIELPEDYPVAPDRATLNDAFGAFISRPLTKLIERCPNMSIILVPSVRDAVSKHVSWPQDKLNKKDLGLPKQVTCVPNPIILSINEIVIGISSQDVLYEMQRQNVTKHPDASMSNGASQKLPDLLARLCSNIIEQRHFFPVFPPLAPESLPKPSSIAQQDDEFSEGTTAVGACLDIPFLKLGDWLRVRPDVVITPSTLTPFAKVVDSVVVINPGETSKRRAAGTYALMTVMPREIKDEERENGGVLGHELYSRTRVDIVRI